MNRSRPRALSVLTWLLALILALLPGRGLAHPMPTATVQLDLHSDYVVADLALPLGELELATQWKLVNNPSALEQYGSKLRVYLSSHLSASASSGAAWTVDLGEPTLSEVNQMATGPYQEFTVSARLTPPTGSSVRDFTLNYDAIVREVKTHPILVSIQRDWERGLNNEGGFDNVEVGVIRADSHTGQVPLLPVNVAQGSVLKVSLCWACATSPRAPTTCCSC